MEIYKVRRAFISYISSGIIDNLDENIKEGKLDHNPFAHKILYYGKELLFDWMDATFKHTNENGHLLTELDLSEFDENFLDKSNDGLCVSSYYDFCQIISLNIVKYVDDSTGETVFKLSENGDLKYNPESEEPNVCLLIDDDKENGIDMKLREFSIELVDKDNNSYTLILFKE